MMFPNVHQNSFQYVARSVYLIPDYFLETFVLALLMPFDFDLCVLCQMYMNQASVSL